MQCFPFLFPEKMGPYPVLKLAAVKHERQIFHWAVEARGLRAWNRQWAGTAEGQHCKGCKTPLPVLLVPEP